MSASRSDEDGCAYMVLAALLALWFFHGCGNDEERMRHMHSQLIKMEKDVEEIKQRQREMIERDVEGIKKKTTPAEEGPLK